MGDYFKTVWEDSPSTVTPIIADNLNKMENGIEQANRDVTALSGVPLASAPDQLASGAITRSATGAATSFAVVWPDGASGTFTGTESTGTPGAIDSYTVTHVLAGTTRTYTQPTLTRDGNGAVTNRPSITVS